MHKFFLVALLGLISHQAFAQKCEFRGLEYVRVWSEFPPFAYLESGRPGGIFTEIYEAIFSEVGVAVKHEFLPIKRYYANLNQQADLTISLNEAQLENTHFKVASPIVELTLGLFHRRELATFPGFDDLSGKRLLTGFGYHYDGSFTPEYFQSRQILQEEISDRRRAAELIALGRQDYWLEYREVGSQAIPEEHTSDIQFHPLKTLQFYLFILKDAPSADAVYRCTEQVVERLRGSNSLNVQFPNPVRHGIN